MFTLVRIGVLASLIVGVSFTGIQSPSKRVILESEVAKRSFVFVSKDNTYDAPQPNSELQAQVSLAGALDLSLAGSERHASVKFDSYGFGSSRIVAQVPVSLAKAKEATGWPQLSLDRAGVKEWFVNSDRGLEQSFQVASRPAGKPGNLWLRLSVNGALTPKTIDSNRIELAAGGISDVYYSGLKAWDANGRALDAQMEAVGNTIVLNVDDANARYPVTIDPTWGQQNELDYGQRNTGAPYQYGQAVVTFGDRGVTGGDGHARAYTKVNNSWSMGAIMCPNANPENSFGNALAMSADRLVIGAPKGAGAGTVQSGAVYVYTKSGTYWKLETTITPTDGLAGNGFGSAMAISADTLVVGAPNVASGTTTNVGAVYIYNLVGSTWTFTKKILSPSVVTDEKFGVSLSISGTRFAAGAAHSKTYVFDGSGALVALKDTIAKGGPVSLLGNRLAIGTTLYSYASNVWSVEKEFPAVSQPSVSLDTDLIAIGNPAGDGLNATGAGCVNLYRYSGGTWVSGTTLTAADGSAGDMFGYAVSLNGSQLFAGAPGFRNGTIIFGTAYNFTQGDWRLVASKGVLKSGEMATGQIFILAPAPAGGVTFKLEHSGELVAPDQVTILEGNKHVDFQFGLNPDYVATNLVSLSASLATDYRVLGISISSVFRNFSVEQISDVGPSTYSGVGHLMSPAPAGGLTITFTSSNPNVVTPPNPVTVPANQKDFNVSGTTKQVNAPTDVAIIAHSGTDTGGFHLVVRPMLTSITINPSSVVRGYGGSGTIKIGRIHHGDFTIPITTDQPSLVTVEPSVLIREGSDSAAFSFTTAAGTKNASATISAAFRGVTLSTKLDLVAAQGMKSVEVIGVRKIWARTGSSALLQFELKGAAKPGGETLALSSSDPTAFPVPATITVPAGQTTVQVRVPVNPVPADKVITFGASYNGQAPKTGTFTALHWQDS